ncbi:MAG: NADH-quinone oxidoreductase subunit K [Bacteriovoracaceae bacterium]|nr:NADH-quinone oxidoreductase subunit K [Bacteriovoracaceae bacterium]
MLFYYTAFILFTIGLIGILIKRSLISIFFSILIMVNGVSLFLNLLTKTVGNYEGQTLSMFTMLLVLIQLLIFLMFILVFLSNKKTESTDGLENV